MLRIVCHVAQDVLRPPLCEIVMPFGSLSLGRNRGLAQFFKPSRLEMRIPLVDAFMICHVVAVAHKRQVLRAVVRWREVPVVNNRLLSEEGGNIAEQSGP